MRTFERFDFEEYQTWFFDREFNRVLGLIDQDWLDDVLRSSDHQQLCFLRNETLVAVAGIHVQDPDHAYYVLTDLAVRPALRRTGIGREVLGRLILNENL